MTDLDTWTEWVAGDLWKEVHRLHRQVQIFQSWRELIEAAVEESKTPADFHDWVTRNYLDSLAIGVRRLSDKDRRTRSLRRLLEEVEENHEELTKDWWMAGAVDPETWEHAFNELSANGDHVDQAIIRKDIDALVGTCESIKTFVDRHIAHLDADRHTADLPTLGDAHSAVEETYRIFRRWHKILTGNAVGLLNPPNWEHVFAVPWIDAAVAAEITGNRWAEKDQRQQEALDG